VGRGGASTTGAKARCAVRRKDAKRWRETRGCDGARVRSPMDGSMDRWIDGLARVGDEDDRGFDD
jgi:hypothetical protein